MTKRAVFIGRFSPFHNGHLSIMKKKMDQETPLLILIRNTHYDEYPPKLRKRMIEAVMSNRGIDAKVMVVDDIESVNYGRGVGYEINKIDVPEKIKNVSATEIRTKIEEGDRSWQKQVPAGTKEILKDYLSRKGIVVWFTGLPCAGKTTIANAVNDVLQQHGIKAERLDGDILRKHITKDLGFTKKDREENLERATFIAKLLARNGVVVLSSFITPYNSIRKNIREEVKKDATFVEVFVKASPETCKKRDTKGMYKKAEKGEIKNFTGVSDPFEEPENPEIVLDTENKSVEQSRNEVVDYIESIL